MRERVETVVVGGGQAGLAMSYHLSQRRREHVVLERARVAERWRSERWDSLTFQLPNWSMQLPGFPYRGPEPDGFAPCDEVVRFLGAYATWIRAPVRCGVTVVALRQAADSARLVLETDTAGTLEADNVVVATGPYQASAVPAVAGNLPPRLVQVHSSRYRSPDALPPGAVLVVGSGASGCQIAEDLHRSGRRVYLSVGTHRRVPRRYRGRDYGWWQFERGALDTIRPEDSSRFVPPLLTGVDGGHDIDLRRFSADGVVLLGHLLGCAGDRVALAPDLAASLAQGDEGHAAFTRTVDAYVAQTGISAPTESPPERLPDPEEVGCPILDMGLAGAGITSVVWATGFHYDFEWLHVPVLDGSGRPIHQRGVTDVPGLCFLGLRWLHTLKSAFMMGVGEDAAFLADYFDSRR